ncbi:MAG: hypothetical protein H6R25_3710 [Proteobacteria bacterium]|nr:hypothetical protein [Pseudomonadota bacterium]
MLYLIFLIATISVMNGAKYQSLAGFIHSDFGFPIHKIALLFSLSNICGLIFGLVILGLPYVRARVFIFGKFLYLVQILIITITILFQKYFSAMIIQRILEGVVFSFIMNFYPVAISNLVQKKQREVLLCFWGLVYAAGFSLSNGLALIKIPAEYIYYMPAVSLTILLMLYNNKIISYANEYDNMCTHPAKTNKQISRRLIFISIPFFLFTMLYNNFIFSFSKHQGQNFELFWFMMLNGVGIIISNIIISLRVFNSTRYLLVLVIFSAFVVPFLNIDSVYFSGFFLFNLGLIEGVIFGYFINHFSTQEVSLVKASYLVSGSLGATIGPLVNINYGSLSIFTSIIFLSALISLFCLSLEEMRRMNLTEGS